MSDEIIISHSEQFMPALSIKSAIDRRNMIIEFTREVLQEGIEKDYGVIPGTTKKTLLKPGAEKLANLFGLTPTFQIIESEKDWTGNQHNGEVFFYFLCKCKLWRSESLIAEGDGACTSWETKYRYRQANRICPSCGQETIYKSRPRQGQRATGKEGYFCWKTKGGCGAQFQYGDQSIESQEAGKIVNPDVADSFNTILKMAEKRALIAAVLIAVNASEFFTQDMEEIVYAEKTMLDQPPIRQAGPPLSELESLREKLIGHYGRVYGIRDREKAWNKIAANFLNSRGKHIDAATVEDLSQIEEHLAKLPDCGTKPAYKTEVVA